MTLKIILDNPDWVVIEKPAGVATEEIPTWLASYLVNRLAGSSETDKPENQSTRKLFLVHRLDKMTSGLLLLAKNEETQIKLQELFKTRQVHKTYQALVVGSPSTRGLAQGEWTDKIERNRKGIFGVSPMGRVAKLAYRKITDYRLQITVKEKEPDKFSLLEVTPVTGRTHQIRVQCKHHGYPIIGDAMYRTKESRDMSAQLGLNRQFLHATRLEFPWNGQNIIATSELAADLRETLEKLTIEG